MLENTAPPFSLFFFYIRGKNMKKIFIIIPVAIVIFILIMILSDPNFYLTPYQKYYAGDVRNFRADLNEARKVPVYPSEDTVRNILFNPDVYKINIAFIPNESENSFYLATTFEITNKMTIVYRHYMGEEVQTFEDKDGSSCLIFYPNRQVRCFRSVPVNSTEELNSIPQEPVILLLGPSHANQTAVSVYDFLITLEGESFEEVDRSYTDLDLAVDKMLLLLMEV
jgi:hypothetical protein